MQASQHVNATVYYVNATQGSDDNEGAAIEKPWKTINRVNQAHFKPGDSILFRSGQVWHEELVIRDSGTAGSTIAFGSYGVGDLPTITGTDTVSPSEWEPYKNHIYRADIGQITGLNQVYVDNKYIEQARWPSTGFRPITAPGMDKKIIDANLRSALGDNDIRGTTVIARTRDWSYAAAHVTDFDSQTGAITTAEPLGSSMNSGYGYFLRGAAWMLKKPGQWHYDGQRYIYLRTPNDDHPALHTVKYSRRDFGARLNKASYISISGIRFSYAKNLGIFVEAGKNVILDSVSTTGGDYGIRVIHCTSECEIRNSKIHDALIGGILASGHKITIQGNFVKNTGYLDSSPPSTLLYGTPYGGANGIEVRGTLNTIADNRIDSSGNNGIFIGKASPNDQKIGVVKGNEVTNSCLQMKDCAGIYTNWPGVKILNNVIAHVVGNNHGTNYPTSKAHGIYMDAGHSNNIVIGNKVIDTDYGIFIHSGYGDKVYSNIILKSRMAGIHVQEDSEPPGYPGSVYGNVIMGNVLEVSLKASGAISLYNKNSPSTANFGTYDWNYYCHPTAVSAVRDRNTQDDTFHNLHRWTFYSGQDSHSVSMAKNCSNTAPMKIQTRTDLELMD